MPHNDTDINNQCNAKQDLNPSLQGDKSNRDN